MVTTLRDLRQRFPEKGGPVELFPVITRFPGKIPLGIREYDGRVDNDGGRCVALVQRRCVNNGFEGGTRLSSGLNGPVELAGAEIPAADHDLHLSGPRFDAKQRRLCIRCLFQGQFPPVGFVGFAFDLNVDDVSHGNGFALGCRRRASYQATSGSGRLAQRMSSSLMVPRALPRRTVT